MAETAFKHLNVQPPTPPRLAAHTLDHAHSFLQDEYDLNFQPSSTSIISQRYTELDTPPQSSPTASQSESAQPRRSKEVKFISQPLPDDLTPGLRRLPSSKSQKCTKSILKQHTPSPSYDSDRNPFFGIDCTSTAPPTFAEMLQSVVQMLAGTDTTSRLDAYRTLMNSLRAHEQLPDRKALRDKLTLLEGFICRDIVENDGNTGSKALALSALKLAIILLELYNAGSFDSRFLGFLLDQALMTIKQEKPTKDMALHWMQLLSTPHFIPKNTQSEPLQGIVKELESISDRVSGTNVHRVRLMICQRLAHRFPAFMSDKAPQWIPHLFHGMLSDNNDLRARAIEATTATATVIGTSRPLSQAISGFLGQDGPDNCSYAEHFAKRLMKLLQKPEDCHQVPQIWGAVIMLLRGSQTLADKWLCSTSWLAILSKCFNSSNMNLLKGALLAWNKTIYAVGTNLSSKVHVMKTLRAPIMGLLQRSLTTKIKSLVFSTYCALLYQSFGPQTSPENLTLCWKTLVQEVYSQVLEKSVSEAEPLATIVSAMFWSSEVKFWIPLRVLQSVPLKLTEVPRLDVTWIRKNLTTNSSVIFTILHAPCRSHNPQNLAIIDLWRNLLRAVAEAGSKEVMVSTEGRKAYAEMVNILYRLCPPTAKTSSGIQLPTTEMLVSLVEAVILELSAVHVGDNILLMTDSGSFEPIKTPSKQAHVRSNRVPQSPFIALLKLLVLARGYSEAGDTVQESIRKMFQTCLPAKPDAKSRLALLNDASQVLSLVKGVHDTADLSEEGDLVTVKQSLLHCLLEATVSLLAESTPVTESTPHTVGEESRVVMAIMQNAVSFADQKSLSLGHKLYSIIRERARTAAGDGAVIIAVNQPLISCLVSNMSRSVMPAIMSYIQLIVNAGVVIASQKSIEHARKALRDQPQVHHDVNGLDWLKHLYSTIGQALLLSYEHFDSVPPSTIMAFFKTMSSFLQPSIRSSRVTIPGTELFLWHMSDGLCTWVEDADGKVFSQDAANSQVRAAVRNLWTNTLGLISSLPLKSSAQLNVVEPLLCAGFQSPDKSIANVSITTWNSTFGAEEFIEYPNELAQVMARLQKHVELRLPRFPRELLLDQQTSSDMQDKKMFPWLESNEDSQDTRDNPTSSIPPVPRKNHALASAPTLMKHTTVNTKPTVTTMKQTTPARLRHYDSQIEFVAVESSPPGPSAEESQLITERQKEVRQRQQEELFLFKDIHSSPARTTTPGEIFYKTAHDVTATHAEQPQHAFINRDDAKQHQSLSVSVDDGFAFDSSPIERLRKGRPIHFESAMESPTRATKYHLAGEEDIPSSPPEIIDDADVHLQNDVAAEPESSAANARSPAAADAEMEITTEACPPHLQIHNPQLILHKQKPDEEAENFELTDGQVIREGHDAREDILSPATTDAAVQHEVEPSDIPQTAAPDANISDTEATDEPIIGDLPANENVDHTKAVPPTFAPLSSSETVIHVEDSMVAPDVLITSEETINSPLDMSSSNAPEMLARDVNSPPSEAPSLSQRMIASHVSLPARPDGHIYQLLSEGPEDPREVLHDEPHDSSQRKRKSASGSPASASRRRKSLSAEESIIVCRPASQNSQSLRDLASQSDIYVTPQKITKSRKRRSVTLSQDNDIADVVEISSVAQSSGRGRKRTKTTPLPQESSIVSDSQTTKKHGRKSPASSVGSNTPTRRSTRNSKSGRSFSAETSFIEDVHMSFNEATVVETVPATIAVPATKNAVSSPWDDTTVDITANITPLEKQKVTAQESVALTAEERYETHENMKDIDMEDPGTDDISAGISIHDESQTPMHKSSDAPETPKVPSVGPSGTLELREQYSTPKARSSAISLSTSNTPPQMSTPAQTTPPQAPVTPTTFARSFLGRLRGLLVDCRNLVLGSSPAKNEAGADEGTGSEVRAARLSTEEAEELHELAHELQGELLKARKRGRTSVQN